MLISIIIYSLTMEFPSGTFGRVIIPKIPVCLEHVASPLPKKITAATGHNAMKLPVGLRLKWA
jgi:hypothetical protein